MTELIGAALRRARPGLQCVAADGPAEALRRAVSMAGSEPVLFRYEKPGPARAALGAIGATAGPAAGTLVPSG